jgi:hypothetical protein
MRTKKALAMPVQPVQPASTIAPDTAESVDVSPVRPSTQLQQPPQHRKKATRREKAVKRELNMDTESDSSEDDVAVLALMHKLDPSVPPFKLDRSKSDIFDKLPPLPGLLLQELNKAEDAMDEDIDLQAPHEDAGPPELLRSLGKRPAPSITSSLKKFTKAPRHMDGGSSVYNATPLVRTKSVCFERPGASASDVAAALDRLQSVCFKMQAVCSEPTWGGGSVLPATGLPDVPDLPAVPDTPTKPDTPPTPELPDAPDVNAVAFITAPAPSSAPASIPPPTKPAPTPDCLHGSTRNLFGAADPDLSEFDNFDD